jgi:thioesterase domain-containing protein/acyl carrier protein
LTAAVFKSDPEGSDRRTYLTGDMGLLRSDGCLLCVGRKDFQVRVRGFRIELEEVEAALLQAPGVKQAVVLARKDLPEDRSLVGYVVPTERRTTLSTSALRTFLREKLPDYAIPSYFVAVAALPLTPNGKLDRQALPAPNQERPELSGGFLAPRTDTEARIAGIWEEVLDVRPVGVKDDFFDLGGNSLQAARLFVRLHKTLGVPLPLSVLLEEATVERLARHVEQADGAPAPSLVPIQPLGSLPPFFCMHALGGEVLCYEKLAGRLGPDQPFFSFQARGLYTEEQPLTTIEAMAARYVGELLAFRPRGPFYLGGYSLGAAVAYEAAQQLRGAGHEVALLVLIDQRRPNLDPSVAWRLGSILRFFRNLPDWVREDLLRIPPSQLLHRARIKLGGVGRGLRRLFRAFAGETVKPDVADVLDVTSLPAVYRKLLQTNLEALRAYVPRPYPGRVMIFQARAQPLFRWHERDLGWAKLLVGAYTLKKIPGNHDDILSEPNVGVLAKELRDCLSRARQGA